MRIVISNDNHSRFSGWGFSSLVDQRILFNTGEAAQEIFKDSYGESYTSVRTGSTIEIE